MKKLLVSGAFLASLLSSTAVFAATELSMWYHGAGNEVEKKIVDQVIADFNGSQTDYTIKLEQFPHSRQRAENENQRRGGSS